MPLRNVQRVNLPAMRPFYLSAGAKISVEPYKPVAELSRVLDRAGIGRLFVDPVARRELESAGGALTSNIIESMKSGAGVYETLNSYLYESGLEAVLMIMPGGDARKPDLLIVGTKENLEIISDSGCGMVSPSNLFRGEPMSKGIVTARVKLPSSEGVDYMDMNKSEIARYPAREIEEEIAGINKGLDAVDGIFEGTDLEYLVDIVTEMRSKMVKKIMDGIHPIAAAQEVLSILDPIKHSADGKFSDDYRTVRGMLNKAMATRYGSGGGWIQDMVGGKDKVVLAAEYIDPTEAAELAAVGKGRILGIATEEGTAMDHLSVVAAGLEVPAVCGLKGMLKLLKNGDEVLVDGLRGVLIVNPSEEQVRGYETKIRCYSSAQKSLEKERGRAPVTRDNYEVMIGVNVESASEARGAVELGVNYGAALVRTFFFAAASEKGDRDMEPTIAEHIDFYSSVAMPFLPAEQSATVRALDVAGDKNRIEYFGELVATDLFEKHPIGMALLLDRVNHPAYYGFLLAQLKGMAIASKITPNLQFMLPNVVSLMQAKKVRSMLGDIRAELDAEGTAHGSFPIGIMVENNSIISAMEVAQRSGWRGLKRAKPAFLSIGSNDLTGNVLRIDRYDPNLAHLYDGMHPKVLKMIKRTGELGGQMEVPVSICGKLASDPLALPVLFGLGIDRYGMSLDSVLLGKRIIRGITREHSVLLADAILGEVATPQEARYYTKRYFRRMVAEGIWDLEPNILDFITDQKV